MTRDNRDRQRPAGGRRGSEGINPLWPVLFVLVLLLGAYLWLQRDQLPDPASLDPTRTPEQPLDSAPVAESGDDPQSTQPQYRVPGPSAEDGTDEMERERQQREADGGNGEPAEPGQAARVDLPDLDESDEAMQEVLAEETTPEQTTSLFVPESMIRHFVVTIDNMTTAKLPQKFNVTQTPPGEFRVEEVEDGIYHLDPANYRRYERYINYAEMLGTGRFISVYTSYYPLFQKAYEELGYPDRYFNDRLVEVIDHLLATPEVEEPVELKRSRVFYEFVDPELEDLTAGQKVLIRMGPDNRARVRAGLQDLRDRLTSLE